MSNSINIESMTIEEKIQTMESIWQDLSKTADQSLSPGWHEDILKKREQDINSGNDEFMDWDTAKKKIRHETS